MMITRDSLKDVFNTLIDTLPENLDTWDSTGISNVQWHCIDALGEKIPSVRFLMEAMNHPRLDPQVRKQFQLLGYALTYPHNEVISEELLNRALALSLDLQSSDYTIIIACYYSGSQYPTKTKAFHVRGISVPNAVANAEETSEYQDFKHDYPGNNFRVVARLAGHHELA